MRWVHGGLHVEGSTRLCTWQLPHWQLPRSRRGAHRTWRSATRRSGWGERPSGRCAPRRGEAAPGRLRLCRARETVRAARHTRTGPDAWAAPPAPPWRGSVALWAQPGGAWPRCSRATVPRGSRGKAALMRVQSGVKAGVKCAVTRAAGRAGSAARAAFLPSRWGAPEALFCRDQGGRRRLLHHLPKPIPNAATSACSRRSHHDTPHQPDQILAVSKHPIGTLA